MSTISQLSRFVRQLARWRGVAIHLAVRDLRQATVLAQTGSSVILHTRPAMRGDSWYELRFSLCLVLTKSISEILPNNTTLTNWREFTILTMR